jgi:hypothetical protein
MNETQDPKTPSAFAEYFEFFEETFEDGAKYFYPNKPKFFIHWKIDFEALGYERFNLSFLRRRFTREEKPKKQGGSDDSSKFPIRLGLYYMDLLQSLYKVIDLCDKSTNVIHAVDISQEVYARLQECKEDESFTSQDHEQFSTLNSELREFVQTKHDSHFQELASSDRKFYQNFECFVDLNLSESKFKRVTQSMTTRSVLSSKEQFCERIMRKYENVQYVSRKKNLTQIVAALGLSKEGTVRKEGVNDSFGLSKVNEMETVSPGKDRFLYKVFLKGEKGFQEDMVEGVDISLVNKIQNYC